MAYLQKHKATKDKLKHLEKSYMIKMAFQICGGNGLINKWVFGTEIPLERINFLSTLQHTPNKYKAYQRFKCYKCFI